MNKNFAAVAAILGAASVGLGAFGAHKLKEIFPPDALTIFETGVRYQFYHVFALFTVSILFERLKNTAIRWAGYFFVLGIIFFSGSLYVIAFLKAKDLEIPTVLGIMTPIGGLFFIIGWLLVFWAVLKNK